MDESSRKTKIRKRLWWFPVIWLEWDGKGERWIMVKWSWKW
jgi:hypothetical protein